MEVVAIANGVGTAPLVWTVMLNDAVIEVEAASVTCTVKLLVPAVLVVPDRTPLALSESPGGRLPEDNDQVYGLVPPVAARVTL